VRITRLGQVLLLAANVDVLRNVITLSGNKVFGVGEVTIAEYEQEYLLENINMRTCNPKEDGIYAKNTDIYKM
jgi:hypothetical protein